MDGVSVGAVARRLGVSSSTVRSWERRYGLGPGSRSAGGHRRYGADDVAVLERMHALVLRGETPARAAELSRAAPGATVEAGPRTVPGGPGGHVLAVPGGGRAVTGLARAAMRLDAEEVDRHLRAALDRDGAVRTWDGLLRPVLVAAGEHWANTGAGIEVEHLLTEAAAGALHQHRAVVGRRLRAAARPVLLACAPDEQHSLVLHALAAALAERAVPTRVLGARVPIRSLASAASRSGAAAVFVWSQINAAGTDLSVIPVTRPPLRIVVGGPGWEGLALDARVLQSDSMAGAVDALAEVALRP